MKRPAAALLGCIAVLFLIAVAGVATIPTVPTGTWQPMGSMAVARSGAAAVLLQDHRVLITGGDNGTDAVNSAEVFNTDGSFANVTAMGTPRSEHIALTWPRAICSRGTRIRSESIWRTATLFSRSE